MLSKLGVLSILCLLLSCNDDSSITGSKTSEGTRINFSISENSSLLSSTRAGGKQEASDIKSFQVLVFETLDDGSEVFSYNANIAKRENNQLEIEAKTSSKNQKYRFVILANADKQVISVNTPKAEALNKFTFDCLGKWRNDGTKTIPMWGESTSFVVEGEKQVAVQLNLALAKVDVGLNFKPQSQENQTNEVVGLDNFKLTSVRVYRTKNLAYVGSSVQHMNGNNKVIKPNIPTVAIYNLDNSTSSNKLTDADKAPLLYKVDLTNNVKGSDKLVNEIFIPESIDMTASATMDEVPCLVIGGYYGADNIASQKPVETFYRLDFANYNAAGTAIESYKPILRNNRYVFDIATVSNPGHSTEEQALNSIPVNIALDLKEWTIDLLNFKVQGSYFFSVDNREVIIPTTDLTGNGEKPKNITDLQKSYVWTKMAYKSMTSPK